MIELSQERLHTLVEEILQEALRQGASSAEVDVGLNKGFVVTARKGEVESVEYNQDKVVSITVYVGKRMGAASLSDLRPDAIRTAVQAACHIARFTDEDPCAGLADKDKLAFNYPNIHLAYPWHLSVEDAIEMARACESQAMAMDKRIVNSEGATVSTIEVLNAYGNTNGFIGIFPVTRHEINCVLIAKQHDEMQRDYSYTVACDPAMLNSTEWVAKTAAERTVRRLGARSVATCQVPVIFLADEARGLLGSFVSAISGGNLYRKSSFLLDHLGKQIFPSHIRIQEKPFLEKSLGSSPFDDDGVATRANVFVEDGVLQSYSLGVYSARKLGMETTGNAGGTHNLVISTGDKDLPALLKKMDKGILVTEVMGNGVNIVTGDYSQGAAGFWVEQGEIQYPVQEITIANNLREMYRNLVEVGNDVDKRGNIQTGSILLENMMVAGE